MRVFFFRSLLVGAVLAGLVSSTAAEEAAEKISLYRSVEQALRYNPQMQALEDSRQAFRHDLRQSRSGYYPVVDLSLGYGLEQHSDELTRREGADPADNDWDPRNSFALSITQRLYDGGETGRRVSIQKALLEAAGYQKRGLALGLSLETIATHLGVFRDRELVKLAERNLQIHRRIHALLLERQRGGVGSVADVSHAKARLARAQVTLLHSRENLDKSRANYSRLTMTIPDPEMLSYSGYPETLPDTLEKALELVAKANPAFQSTAAELAAAEDRVGLARSNYLPKIELRLSSRYFDQLEGSDSWENTNEAMVNLQWNLYNGGYDAAATAAALSRRNQVRSTRENQLLELRERTVSAWVTHHSLNMQKAAFREATEASRETLVAYLEQFWVSRRSLIDVLIAANDYFQSSSQLINASVDETLSAYEILALTGDLRFAEWPRDQEYPKFLKQLSQESILALFPPIEVPPHGEPQSGEENNRNRDPSNGIL